MACPECALEPADALLHAMARARAARAWRLAAALLPSLLAACATAPGLGGSTGSAYPRIETGEHVGAILRLAVDAEERWLVTAGLDKTARVWNLATGQADRVLRPPIADEEQGGLYAVAISADGRRVFVGGSTGEDARTGHAVYVFDRASGRLVARSVPYTGAPRQLALSPDGKRIAVLFDTGVGLRILQADEPARELARDTDCMAGAVAGAAAGGLDFDRGGRLAAACDDGSVRLYGADGKALTRRNAQGAERPAQLSFSPDGERLAVAHLDAPVLAVWSAADLTALGRPVVGANVVLVPAVAWSADGTRLHAVARLRSGGSAVLTWVDRGRGTATLQALPSGMPNDVAALSGGRLVVAGADASWQVLAVGGRVEPVRPATLDLRDSRLVLRLSPDARRMELQLGAPGDPRAVTRLRFDIAVRASADGDQPGFDGLKEPLTTGLPVAGWQGGRDSVRLNGQRLGGLQPHELTRALSVAADRSGFVLGTSLALRAYDAAGLQRWQRPLPAPAMAVHQGSDGQFAVAALEDGTVRWYDAASGRERLAVFVHARDRRWVVFTPEGFYDAALGGDVLLGYHVNQGDARAAEFIESAQVAGVYYRPDLVTRRAEGDEDAVAQELQHLGDPLDSGGWLGNAIGKARLLLGSVGSLFSSGLPPRVTLLSPPVVKAAPGGEYDLSVRVDPARPGEAVGALRIQINGAEVQATRGVAPAGGGVVTQRLSLAPGLNTVSVRAMRADGKVASSEVVAQVQVGGSQTPPTLRLLAVGVSQYDDATFRNGVRFASRDADEIVKRLRSGATGFYREVDARLLNRREDTTLERIDAELTALVKRARPEDVVVIYLAGHGRAPRGQYHFIPADFIYDGDRAFDRNRTLTQARLEQVLKELGAGKRLLILDTCDSGSAVQSRGGATEQKDALARLFRSSGRYILAAASPQGRALEDGVQGHGVYTAALLEGLAGAADPARKGTVEVDALADYVSRRVPELTAPAGYQQRPMRSAQGENFPIVRTVPRL